MQSGPTIFEMDSMLLFWKILAFFSRTVPNLSLSHAQLAEKVSAIPGCKRWGWSICAAQIVEQAIYRPAPAQTC